MFAIPRPRKPEGTRRRDKERVVFVHVPNEIFDQLEARGKPSKVILDMVFASLEKDKEKVEV